MSGSSGATGVSRPCASTAARPSDKMHTSIDLPRARQSSICPFPTAPISTIGAPRLRHLLARAWYGSSFPEAPTQGTSAPTQQRSCSPKSPRPSNPRSRSSRGSLLGTPTANGSSSPGPRHCRTGSTSPPRWPRSVPGSTTHCCPQPEAGIHLGRVSDALVVFIKGDQGGGGVPARKARLLDRRVKRHSGSRCLPCERERLVQARHRVLRLARPRTGCRRRGRA